MKAGPTDKDEQDIKVRALSKFRVALFFMPKIYSFLPPGHDVLPPDRDTHPPIGALPWLFPGFEPYRLLLAWRTCKVVMTVKANFDVQKEVSNRLDITLWLPNGTKLDSIR